MKIKFITDTPSLVTIYTDRQDGNGYNNGTIYARNQIMVKRASDTNDITQRGLKTSFWLVDRMRQDTPIAQFNYTEIDGLACIPVIDTTDADTTLAGLATIFGGLWSELQEVVTGLMPDAIAPYEIVQYVLGTGQAAAFSAETVRAVSWFNGESMVITSNATPATYSHRTPWMKIGDENGNAKIRFDLVFENTGSTESYVIAVF